MTVDELREEVRFLRGKLVGEETAYDKGYDDGFAARDGFLRDPQAEESLFKTRVVGVLREVGLLGNNSVCP